MFGHSTLLYKFQQAQSPVQQNQIQTGGSIETPTQIDKVINKNLVKRKRPEAKPEDDYVSPQELAKAFEKLNFTSKRANKRSKKSMEAEDYEENEPQMYGGSIAYL
jgi:hypothetical protein